jgi:anti-sigma B factor antagonist
VERSSGAAPPRRSSGGDDVNRTQGDLLGVEIGRSANGHAVVALAGELDLSSIPMLEGRLLEELRDRDSVIVDLTRLTFIDSSGMGVLIKAHRATNGAGGLHLVVSDGSQVERVFTIAGMGSALPIFPDRGAAIAALDRPVS